MLVLYNVGGGDQMRDDETIRGNRNVKPLSAVRSFMQHTGAKIVWVFGSVVSLVAFSAAYASMGHGDSSSASNVDASATMARQQSRAKAGINEAQPTEQRSAASTTRIESTTSTPSAPVDVKLRVNNIPIPLPEQGTVHKDIRNADGTTTVDVRIDSTSSDNSTSQSSSSVILRSSTESTSSTTTNTENSP